VEIGVDHMDEATAVDEPPELIEAAGETDRPGKVVRHLAAPAQAEHRSSGRIAREDRCDGEPWQVEVLGVPDLVRHAIERAADAAPDRHAAVARGIPGKA